MRTYKILSLFSGCGGMDIGFSGDFKYLGSDYGKRNFELSWANDIDKNACKTFKEYFNHDIVCGDIVEIIEKNEKPSIFPPNIDIVLGGFPCQDFSHAGKRLGFGSQRGLLYQSMVKVVKKTKPLLFIAENVKGLLTMENGEALKTIIKDFEALGYNVTHKLYLASDYGVPQKRERVIIVGTLKEFLPPFEHPCSTHKREDWVTLGEAIGDLEHVAEGGVLNHFWSKAKKNKGQGNTLVSKEGQSPTMRAEHHGNIEFHWNGARRLSAREAARIQSFPDNMEFFPSTSSAYKQIGNAVPPVLAWNLARSVEKFLDENIKKIK